MSELTWSPRARAALLRDESGAVVGTTWGDTACWNPRRPGSFRAVDEVDGREHVIRCRSCPGCREYEAYELERRLAAHYAGVADEIWCIIVDCPLAEQRALAASLLRRKCLALEPGHFKLGAGAVAFLAAGRKPEIPRDVARRRRCQVVRVKRSRGRRAWTIVTAGLRQHRNDFGEWTNRFYCRGLKQRERSTRFHFSSRGGIIRRHNLRHDAVAFKDGIAIHRPEVVGIVWSPKRSAYEQRFGTEAVAAGAILNQVLAFAAGGRGPLSPLSPSESAPRLGGAPIGAAVARRSSRTQPTAIGSILGMGARTEKDSLRPILGRKRYAGSLHSTGGVSVLREWLERNRGGPGG